MSVSLGVTVREMLSSDGPRVLAIYQEGLDTGLASFETTAPPWEKWDSSHLASCRFVAESGGTVVGWAALSSVSDRCVYAGVAELSIYVAASARGRGVGSALMSRLIEASEAEGYWTLNSGVFPENEATVALHQKFGFRTVGRRDRIGQRHGVWRDTLLLERRSQTVGQ